MPPPASMPHRRERCRESVRAGLLAVVLAGAALPAAAQDACDPCSDPPGPRTLGDGPSGVASRAGALEPASLALRRVVLGDPGRASLRAAEVRRRRDGLRDLPRLGVRRGMRRLHAPRVLSPGLRGVTAVPDGGRLWTGEVAAPGSRGLRLRFSHFDLPPGATVTLHDADEPSESYGPFTGRGPRGTGSFHAPTVFGERLRVELHVPAEAAGSSVALAAHSLLDLHSDEGLRAAGSWRATQCAHVDVACDDAVMAAGPVQAAALMVFASGGGCSGALIADSDASTQIPWFLTAHHCVSTDDEAAGIEFYFDDRAATCNGPAPSLAGLPRALGATVHVTSQPTDVTLLRIDGTMPGGRTYLGWSLATAVTGTGATGVHHPALDPMKVSRGRVVGSSLYFVNVDWTTGFVEPGSSGSPLLDNQYRIIGQLWGGQVPWCGTSNIDYYGRFDVSWPLLKPYLAPDQSKPVPPPGVVPVPDPGPPVDFYWGLWNRAFLKGSEYRVWEATLFPPPRGRTNTQLRVALRGPKGTWTRIVDPNGTPYESRKPLRIRTPKHGEWTVEVHSPGAKRSRIHGVRIRKNF